MTEMTRDPAPFIRRGAGLRGPLGLILLATLCGIALLAELGLGPTPLSLDRIFAALRGEADAAAQTIFTQIRAPRALLALAAGAGLGLAGLALQGVLRNPLADPGLIGVTGGASVGAVATIVFGETMVSAAPAALRPWVLAFAAFIGAALTVGFILKLARREGMTSAATLILAGVAVNAIAGALVGVAVYLSNDNQLRDFTLWSMGGLGGADMRAATVVAVVTLVSGLALLRLARPLDLLQLGEGAAFHAGLDVERAKRAAALWAALAVGAAVSVAGPIGFIGLVGPHLARMIVGPGHRLAAPASALLGATLLLVADLAVRLVAPPSEPPVGLAMGLMGGPFFLWLLIRRRNSGGGFA